MNTNFKIIRIFIAVILAVSAIIALYPFVYMLLLSLTQSESLVLNIKDIELSLINYERVFTKTNFSRALFNSIIVAFFSCFFNVVICAMAGYAFEKKEFRGKKQIFALYVATLAIPGQVTLIPIFTIIKSLGLMNTYVALILPSISAFGVFLMKQFMSGLPDELLEVAQVDGASEMRTFLGIVLPLSKPIIISLIIFTFISSWNNFLWPLVISTTEDMQTLTLALSILKGNFVTNYGLVMAGSVITFIFPFTLYLFLQKQFVEGIALSGIKG